MFYRQEQMAGLSREGLLQWDLVSAMPIPHMSFILRHYMPMTHSDPDLDVQAVFKKAGEKVFNVDGAYLLPCGSTCEGLDLPAILVKNAAGKYIKMITADIDLMAIGNKKTVGEKPESTSYLIETDDTHPGYTRLQIVKPEDTSESLKTFLITPSKYYLNAANCTAVSNHTIELDPGMEVVIQGPAVTFEIPAERFYHSCSSTMKEWGHKSEGDLVYGLIVPQWPSVACEWAARKRTAKWPSKDIIEDIVSKGCHVVPAGHVHSTQRDLEWRFSFSYAEGILAANLTRVQKQCYLLLKTLHLCAFKHPKGIVSYHLKTLLLWAAEEIPQAMWTEDTVGSMLIYLLDKLLYCLIQHNLPSYFIPSNNLIDTVPAGVIDIVKLKVSKVRQDPVGALMKFNKTHKFNYEPILSDIGDTMKPVFDDMPNANKLSVSFVKALTPAGRDLARSYITDFSLRSEKVDAQLRADLEEYTLPFDNTINVCIDLARMAKNIILMRKHPSELLVLLLTNLEPTCTYIRFLEHVLRRFPKAPNRPEIEAILEKMLRTCK